MSEGSNVLMSQKSKTCN